MLYKMSLSVNEIPPLFVQLDKLERKDQSVYWKEKARWIRFEEQAEDVLGRWSKPHVATVPQTALDDLKDLLANGKVMLDVLLTDMSEIADTIANELIEYFDNDLEKARKCAELICLQHQHHHEKKVKKTLSNNNLSKIVGSGSIQEKKDVELVVNERSDNPSSQLIISPSRNQLKYQYSFVDAGALEETSSVSDFKENTKFKKKVHRKAEGASVLVMPCDFVNKSKIVFLRLEAATELQGFLEVKLRSRFIALIIGPQDKAPHLYEIGRALSTCLADDVCRELFYSASNQQDILDVVKKFNRGTMVLPPGEWNPLIRIEPPEKFLSKEERHRVPELSEYIHNDEASLGGHDHADPTLKGSRKPFNGILQDVKRKIPFFVSDFTDALNLQCIATTLYMYLVSLCSLVAFGGMLGKKTGDSMATMECILAGSVCGVMFSLFAGQPLNIVSATGPMLILESIIKDLCGKYHVDFMEFRLWVGLWTATFLFLLVAFNLSFLVKYITRFTEDCFATLVAIIFIIDALKSTVHLKDVELPREIVEVYFNETNEYRNVSRPIEVDTNSYEYKMLVQETNTNFFFSVILFIITFAVCMTLKGFREKPYLPSKIRSILSDFAVLIAIVLASLLDNRVGLNTQKLTIPDKFQPTANRSWIVPFFEKNSFTTILIATIPALIATILVFMDQQITAVIVNRKEFKLKKSSGYHLDLFIIAASIAVSSILGLPWFVAATVLALTHVNSLKVMSENTAPGEKPSFVGVREQRATTFIMSVLIGLSVFLTKVLSMIPMATLYGVFMFMGVSALGGMQFFERILILFMPAKHQPDRPYLRHVSTGRVHLFTLIQIFSTSGLYAIKFIESVAITFPILVLATCGIRKLLDFVFTQRELFWLDDILPGSGKHKNANHNKSADEHLHLTEQSSSEIYKSSPSGHNTEPSASSTPTHRKPYANSSNPRSLVSSDFFKNIDSCYNSTEYVDYYQQDPSIRYIDCLDENNNNQQHHATATSRSSQSSTGDHQVKFAINFENIKEDDDN